MKTQTTIASIFAFTLILSACMVTKTKAYLGEELPPSEVAIIKGDRCFKIHKVDGKLGYYTAGIFRGELTSKGFEIHFLPGRHTFDVSYSCHYARSVRPITLEFNAQKNTVYKVAYKLSEKKNSWSVWIEKDNQQNKSEENQTNK